VCDKGGECPLQNLTMAFSSGQSRFLFDEKMHMQKHVPLGELIFLDRERCIQCGRCTRFQHEVVDDPVIGFHQRGRSLEIITYSEPGFDSIWSGNTTDICPVGALTTADFRFGARAWELNTAASICNHCPVGCNLTYNVRQEARSGGKTVIKRTMPRHNEAVNEIWICDRGRFGYHYTESPERLTQPLVRKNNQLQPARWEEALALVAEKIQAAGENTVTLVGGRLANEDLFNLRQLAAARGGRAALYSYMAGGDLVAQVGLMPGSNFGEMGKGTAILVIASDLHDEAPLWWLRIKQAVKRGATLILLAPRFTRLEKYAAHKIRYTLGEEGQVLASFLPANAAGAALPLRAAAEAFAAAENAVILFGSEGLGLEASTELSQVCAELLVKTQHFGKPNNGLVGVWPNGNTQGAWDMGFRPLPDLRQVLGSASVAYVAAADPAGDDPELAQAIDQTKFVVVQELFLTETARRADVVLPALAVTEREGTFTSGERRVQRFYPAVNPLPDARADFTIAAQLGKLLGLELEERSTAEVMRRIAECVRDYQTVNYAQLAETVEQWPVIGRSDLYYGGTSYDNTLGMGQHLPVPQRFTPEFPSTSLSDPGARGRAAPGALLAVPFTCLYDRGQTVVPSKVLEKRLAGAVIIVHPETAKAKGWSKGEEVSLTLKGTRVKALVRLEPDLPRGVAFVPRSVGLPVDGLTVLES
jgi:NADH-quinone oxidoreductase subunit G